MGESTGRFWRELRRRRVVSTAAAYAAVAFVVLQLGEILFPAFGFGPTALQALFWILLSAAPVVLALSWVFDVTRRGLQRTVPLEMDESGSDGDGVAEVVEAPQRVPAALAFVMGLTFSALLGAFGWSSMHEVPVEEAAASTGSTSSIAVLPFVDRSPDQDQAHLGDGMAEEVLTVLAGVEGLQVAARTSSFAFRSTSETPLTALQIGEQLNVGWLLEGSVLRDADRLRVSAALVEAQTGRAVWTQSFESESGDLIAVQDSIAAAIVSELLGRLDLPDRLATRHVAPPEAQDAYYRGRAQWNRRDAAAIPMALRLFQEAVQRDSLYAVAYSGLADSYALLPQFVPSASAEDSWRRAEEFAARALELDPSLAEAHTSLGLVRAMRGDRVGAIRAFDRALEFNASYAPAFHWRANVHADLTNLQRALQDIDRAARLDPLSPAIAADRGSFLLWSGDLGGAEAEFERALELEFGLPPALFGKAMVALERDESLPFMMLLTQWGAVTGIPGSLAGRIARAISTEGSGAGAVLSELEVLESDSGPRAAALARLYALLGDRAGMLRMLRRAAQDGSWVTEFLAVNPIYEPYRDDPGFLEVLSELSTG